jgi:predicted nucleic acid-binding protein
MKACFLDTNLFIRYLTNDDPVKTDRVDNLLNQAAVGKIKLVIVEIVLIEVVWVLESYYSLEKETRRSNPMLRSYSDNILLTFNRLSNGRSLEGAMIIKSISLCSSDDSVEYDPKR